jgi:Zn-finger nucleic acid-binding protein
MGTRDGALTALGCVRCGGVWLDNAASRRLLAGANERAALAIANHLDPTASPPARRDDAYRTEQPSCPMCGAALARVVTDPGRHPIAGIELDVCAPHGTWFDANDLRAIAIAVSARLASEFLEAEAIRAQEDALVSKTETERALEARARRIAAANAFADDLDLPLVWVGRPQGESP